MDRPLERWPHLEPYTISQSTGFREVYLARYRDLQQFKFVDPLYSCAFMNAKTSHLLFSKNFIFSSQGPVSTILSIDGFLERTAPIVSQNGHGARITSMRLFPLKETWLFRNETHINENVLVTSSCDHSIRLLWKGSCQRSFRGHNGPVTVLSDRLLGDENGKVFASGGEDSTVRLWSLTSSGKRGQKSLKATLYGHEKPIALMSVTGHSASLIVSMATDSKVRVWDASVSSSDRNSSCVGTTSVPGVPVGIKCHDSLIYIAAGSTIEAVDLRTMTTAFRTLTNQGKLYSFDLMPSKFLACTGGLDRAMLWDIRKSKGTGESDPIAELDGHKGPVSHLHMDPYKIVTSGPEDTTINIWETDTGNQTNSLTSSSLDGSGYSSMAVDGLRIATATHDGEQPVIHFRDFNNAVCSRSTSECVIGSKFWRPLNSSTDGDESDG
ncbi:F-box domain, cyclin-like protein [Tanacetum coccineum]